MTTGDSGPKLVMCGQQEAEVGGANEHGSVLSPDTLARMFEPHYQPDPRIPGMGLGFFRDEAGSHRTVGHDGIWNGFRTDMVLAPDERIGVLAFANSGGFDPRGAPVPAANAVLRSLLDLPNDTVRTDLPEHPGEGAAADGIVIEGDDLSPALSTSPIFGHLGEPSRPT